jgi:hypothetical protein
MRTPRLRQRSRVDAYAEVVRIRLNRAFRHRLVR